MIKSLLVPVDSSAYSRSALEHALELGKLYQARVTGLYVLDVRYLEMPPYLDYSYAFEAVAPTLVPLDVLEKFRAKSERILNEFKESDTERVQGIRRKGRASVRDAHRGRRAQPSDSRHRGCLRPDHHGQTRRACAMGEGVAGYDD